MKKHVKQMIWLNCAAEGDEMKWILNTRKEMKTESERARTGDTENV